MLKMISVASLVVAIAPAVSSAQQERQMGGVGLTVFGDANFRGLNATFRQATPDLRESGMHDSISSLQVAPGELWEACENINYGGRCQVFSGTESDLSRRGWNDMISSVRPVRGGGGTRPPSRGGLELFSSTRFQGNRRVLTDGVADFRELGFNDQAMSLRMGRSESWEVCVDINYQDCRVVNSDVSELSSLEMASRISSARPWRSGRGGIRPPVQAALVLFDERGFRGQSVRLDRAERSLPGFANRAESVEVASGVWELCELPDFQGRCVSVSSSERDLGALGLRNRVSSVRPVRTPR